MEIYLFLSRQYRGSRDKKWLVRKAVFLIAVFKFKLKISLGYSFEIQTIKVSISRRNKIDFF